MRLPTICTTSRFLRNTSRSVIGTMYNSKFHTSSRYLYYEEAEVTGDSVMQILYCSKKYLVPGLTNQCTHFLEKNLSGENATTILEQCLLFDEQEMVCKCMKVIREDTRVMLKSESFGKVSNDILVKILESDSSTVSEVELFNGCLDWARSKTSGKKASGDRVREIFGKALYKLRFPAMTIEEFGDIVVPTEILNNEEEISCYRYFSQKKKPTSMPFPTIPRSNNSCPLIHLTHDKNISLITYPKQAQYILFTIENNSAKDLSIKGFVTYEHILALHYMKYIVGGINSGWTSPTHIYSVGICKHDIGKEYITFPFFTIPAGSIYRIQMNSLHKCISTDRVLTFSDPNQTISVLVKGYIPISEIIIAKSTN